MTETTARKYAPLAIAAGMVVTLCGGVAQAQEDVDSYPSKAIRLVVPFPAGGGTDTMARLIAKSMQDNWGQTVIVDNPAGASGQIGAAQVAKAPGDGYTVMLSITSLIQHPALYDKLPYDVFKDFKPVSILSYSSDLIMVPANSPYKSIADLVADAKARPGQVTIGSYGTGTSSHLHIGLFQLLTDTNIIHVPYRGAAPEVIDLIGGQIDAAFVDVTSARPHLDGDKVRTLAVTGSRRVGVVKDAPTLGELGYEGYNAHGWFAVFVPSSTPDAIVEKLSKEINRIVDTPEFQERLETYSLTPGGTTPEESLEIMRRDAKGWASIVKRANITLD